MEVIMPLKIVRNDITRMNTDAIVNPANPYVSIGGGIDAVIYKSAGIFRLLKERQKVGKIAAGDVAVTSGCKLPCKYIFHVSGPQYIDGMHNEEDVLRSCYKKSLLLAQNYHCDSIAFPLLATDTYGFPKEEAIQIALSIFREFLMIQDIDIYLVVSDRESTKISGELFRDAALFVDEHYVVKIVRSEHDDSMTTFFLDTDTDSEEREDSFRQKMTVPRMMVPSMGNSLPVPDRLDDYINRNTGSFVNYLQQLINKKGMSNAEVYKRANLSKQYFSKMMHGQVNPTKEKLLCIAVALKLNLDETTDFLRFGGYALTPYNKMDLVFEYFISHHNFDIFSIDIALFDLGLPSLMD